jgi:type IV secretory pathway VirB2 component (pilin)
MESWMPFFVVVTALAIVLQAAVLIALFVQLRRTAARVEQTVADFQTKVMPLVSRVQVLVEDISPRISGIVADASEITRLARGEAQKVDRIVNEALERLRMQLIHIDHILTGAMEAVEEAGSHLRQTVWGPVVKATALIRGVQAGIDFFRNVRQGREPVETPAEQPDEGMFI